MELAARLTEEHLEKAEALLNKGLPESTVAKLLGIPIETWKMWKRAAREIMAVVDGEIKYLYDEGFLAKDGTPLGFVVVDGDNTPLSRHQSKEDAGEWIKKQGKALSGYKLPIVVEDETEEVEELIRIKTTLRSDQIKVTTLLHLCEKGKAYAIDGAIDNIISAGSDTWQASAWLAERLDREHFGRQEVVQHQGAIGVAGVELTEEEESQFKNNLGSIFGGIYGRKTDEGIDRQDSQEEVQRDDS